MSEYPRGRFCWHELLTPDPDAAKNFYSAVTGWGTEVWDGAGEPYLMWTNNQGPLGGVMQLPEEAKAQGATPHWLSYIAVPDTDAAVARAKELGAKVYVEPEDIPTVGRFAVLADPQGAVFAVFTAAEAVPGHDEPPAPGEFSWHELATTDHEAAWNFYSELFGWRKTDATDLGEMGVYQMFGRGSFPLGGMFDQPSEMPGPPNWLLYIMVEDVNDAIDKVKALGGQVLSGPMEVPGSDLIARCMDPQGATFALHSPGAGR